MVSVSGKKKKTAMKIITDGLSNKFLKFLIIFLFLR